MGAESAPNVRSVTSRDISTLAELERTIWTKLGTPIMSADELSGWEKERSPFFLLAEEGGDVVGYCFARRISFFPNASSFRRLKESCTGKGTIEWPSDPSGNAVYGVSIASSRRGAGGALRNAVYALLEDLQTQYRFSMPRLSGFDAYAKVVENEYGGSIPFPLEDVARWYAHENARALALPERAGGEPVRALALPPIEKLDPVLAFHTRGTASGLVDVLPGYMPDPESRDYAALVLSTYPHR